MANFLDCDLRKESAKEVRTITLSNQKLKTNVGIVHVPVG